MINKSLDSANSKRLFSWLHSERGLFVFFLLWSLWLSAEYWLLGPLSYVRIHDTANTHLPVVISLTSSWRQLWSQPLMNWLCSIDRLSNYGWWSTFSLPFLILPPWLAYGMLMALQRWVASYFTYRLMRDCFGGSIALSITAGCIYSLLHTDLGEIAFMHALNEPGVPMLLWFFWRLPLNRMWRAIGWSLLLGVVLGWSMSVIIGTAFILPSLWLALQAGQMNGVRLRERMILTAAMGFFVVVSLLPRIPELWSLALSAPESFRGQFTGVAATDWMAFAWARLCYIGAWWPFVLAVVFWLTRARWSQPQDRVIAILLLIGVVAAPFMDPLRNALSPWIGFLRGVDFKRFQIIAPLALVLTLFHGLVRWSGWTGHLMDPRGRRSVEVSLTTILAAMIWVVGFSHSIDVKQAHWRLQRYDGYNWRALFGNDDLAEYVKQANEEGLRFATAGAHMTLHPGYLLAYGAETADGHSQLYSRRYYGFWSEVIRPLLKRDAEVAGFHRWGQYVYLHHARSGEDYFVREIPFADWYNLDLLSLAGVGYIVADKPIADERLQLLPMPIYEQRMAAWESLSAASKVSWYVRGTNPGRKLYVYRNEQAVPRYFLVPRLRVYADVGQLEQALGEMPLDELRAAALALSPEVPEGWEKGSWIGSPGEVILDIQRGGFRKLKIRTDQPAILIVMDQYYRWWNWTVNGKNATFFPVYSAFIGVPVPAGESVVEGHYAQPVMKALGSLL